MAIIKPKGCLRDPVVAYMFPPGTRSQERCHWLALQRYCSLRGVHFVQAGAKRELGMWNDERGWTGYGSILTIFVWRGVITNNNRIYNGEWWWLNIIEQWSSIIKKVVKHNQLWWGIIDYDELCRPWLNVVKPWFTMVSSMIKHCDELWSINNDQLQFIIINYFSSWLWLNIWLCFTI